MILLLVYIALIILAATKSRPWERNSNIAGTVIVGGIVCGFFTFVFANLFANEVKTFTPITSPIVREVVNDEVVLTFTTSDGQKWSLPSDTPSEVGYRNALVDNDSVGPSLWVSLMGSTIPDSKSLLIAP